ncbi:MAG: hypothetical protein WAP51_03030 [Candidatus Sungiibacteriota bacterium]
MKRIPSAYWWQKRHLKQSLGGFWRNLFWQEVRPMPIFIDPLNAYVSPDVEIGAGTVIEPNVWIMGSAKIGKNCRIGFGSVIIDSTLEDNVKVAGARIEKSYVEHDAEIGYTAQLKRTRFGAYSKMLHRGYLGDAEVGHHVNIGADVTTANYDGVNKNKTVIVNYAFIGTGVNLVAPIIIPEGAMIASGSTVTGKDALEPWQLFVARATGRLSRSKRVRWDEKGWHLENQGGSE